MRVFIYIFCLSLLITSCRKDDQSESKEVTTQHVPEVLGEKNGSILGLVTDEENNPVAGATISYYKGSTTTDDRGVFTFVDVALDPHGTYFRVLHPNYVSASDKIFPTSGTAYSSIQMIALNQATSFESDEGGEIGIKGGGSVTFSPNSIVDKSQNSYNGRVYVTSKYLNPNDPHLGDVMPGDLTADDAKGNTVVLGTAGMVMVDLRDEEGNELNIAPDRTAQLSVPYVSSDYPDEIDLWSFDEDKGRWQHEGKANRDGNFYKAEVSHFSFWNCDVPFHLINLCGAVKTQGGEAVRTKITIRTDDFGTTFGYTDSEGNFCGKVPKNAELEILVRDVFCGTTAKTVLKGPFPNDVTLDDIIIDDLLPNIQGEVLCSGVIHDESTVLLYSEDRTFVVNDINQGKFDVNLNALCVDIPELEIRGYNNLNNQASNVESVDLNSPDYYELEVCINPCEFEGEFDYECGNTILGINLIGGTGTYSYQWSNGSSGSSITLVPYPESYCVTIVEGLSGCEKVYCMEASGEIINISLSSDDCYGDMYGQINNGIPPYEISTDFGVSDVTNNNYFSFFPGASGVYCVTVIDKNGCIADGCIDVNHQVDQPGAGGSPYGCDKNEYYVFQNFVDWAEFNDGQGNFYPIQEIDGDKIVFDVFETGYNLKWLEVWGGSCSYSTSFQMPFFRGMIDSLAYSNTTCVGCLDGNIDLTTVQIGEECFNCTYGGVLILDSEKNDVTANNGALEEGMYYVVAYDLHTECYIAHQVIEIK